MIPTEEGPGLSRAPYAVLGVAGIVVATVFAAVATLASNPTEQAQPLPVIPGPVSTTGTTSRTGPVIPVPTTPSTEAVAATTTGKPTTTTTRARPTTTTTTTTEPAPPPPPPPPPQPKPPVARFTPTCDGFTCSFDATGAHDPDGRIIYYRWEFGDGAVDDGPDKSRVAHTYPSATEPRTYNVRLVVMDNSGTIRQASHDVTVPKGG